MEDKKTYTPLQTAVLVVLRILIGWHFLYEGMVKLFNPEWSASGFLNAAQWIFSDFYHWLASSSVLLTAVNFMNEWGLVLIGAGLISGLFTRYAALFGGILLLFYYFATPPLIGLEYSIPSEGSYLIVNKTLIEAVTLFALALLPQTSSVFGFDYFLNEFIRKNRGGEDK